MTTQVYWLWVPRRSVMIVGRAFETTVEDRNATNIASNIPESASRICRWVIWPCCSTGADVRQDGDRVVVPEASSVGWTVLLTVLLRGSSVRSWWWRSSGGGDGGAARRGAAGGLEVGDEAVEQVAEQAGVGLVPAGEGAERPLGAQGAGRGERVGAGGGEAEQAGAAVLRVGPALDVARAARGRRAAGWPRRRRRRPARRARCSAGRRPARAGRAAPSRRTAGRRRAARPRERSRAGRCGPAGRRSTSAGPGSRE